MEWMQICLLLIWSVSILAQIADEDIKIIGFLNKTFTDNLCRKSAPQLYHFRHDLMSDWSLNKAAEYILFELENKKKNIISLKKFMGPGKLSQEFSRDLELALTSIYDFPRDVLAKSTKANLLLERLYSTTRICPYKNINCNTTLEGIDASEINRVYGSIRDNDELIYYWLSWREAFGPIVKKFYTLYTDIRKEEALGSKFGDYLTAVHHLGGDISKYTKWLKGTSVVPSDYLARFRGSYRIINDIRNLNISKIPRTDRVKRGSNSVNVIDNVGYYTDQIWKNIQPLYDELHKYVMRKLKLFYGHELDISDGLLPAHVLGSIYGRSWYNIEQLVKPFPNAPDGNVEENMKKLYKPMHMFRAVEELHLSLNLKNLRKVFGSPPSMITKAKRKTELSCVPRSTDLCNGTYSVSMCTEVGFEDFLEVHRVLGHSQYQLQRSSSTYLMKQTTKFLEIAIGDAIGLSGVSPRHLKKLRLLTNYAENYETTINHLLKMALIKIPPLPLALTIESWRWDILMGRVKPEEINNHWWKYRMKHEKLKPPVNRHEIELDAAGLYEVFMDKDPLVYFFGHVAEFQIHNNLCRLSKKDEGNRCPVCPISNCDFSTSAIAANLLVRGMRQGYLENWSKVLQTLAGTEHLNSDALWEYFEPLYHFLKKDNELSSKPVPVSITTPIRPHILDEYETLLWILFSVAVLVFIIVIIIVTQRLWKTWFQEHFLD